jgi:predicted ATPase
MPLQYLLRPSLHRSAVRIRSRPELRRSDTRALTEGALAHAIETAHVPTVVLTYVFKALFEMVLRRCCGRPARRGNCSQNQPSECAYTNVTQGALVSAWASTRLDDRETGATELRQALEALTDQGDKLIVPFFQGLLADIEAKGDAAGALTRIDEALAVACERGEHWSDAFLYRLRGEILLKRDPTDWKLSEEEFLAAIAVAQQQKARSFELRAALDLARLYSSTSRSADAHALLVLALEGFSPTPELAEIAEAQALLTALTS